MYTYVPITVHTTQAVRNKEEKLEHKFGVIFDTLFMIQSQDKNIKKILGALQNLPANQHSQSSSFYSIMAKLSALVIQPIESKGHPGLLHTNFQHGLISKMASPLCSNFSNLFFMVYVVCVVKFPMRDHFASKRIDFYYFTTRTTGHQRDLS